MVIVRALAGLVLGLVIFAGLLYLLVVVNFSQRLEDPEVYRAAIDENDAYNRVYDEVLVDDALDDQTEDLLGGVEFDVRDEAVEILKDVMPPAYLREQTEANIDRLTGFLKEDIDSLNFYIELEEPLERVEPAVLERIYKKIDELQIEGPQISGCSETSLRQLARQSALPYVQLSDGEIPDSAPSLEVLNRECRAQEFDRWFDLVLIDPSMNSEAARILEEEKEVLRQDFEDGDTRAFLKQAATSLVTPVIEDAIRDIRRDLQRNDRLDILDKLAENSDDISRSDIDEQAESLRGTVRTANGSGRIIALVMVIVGVLLLGAVHLPKPTDVLRWPGVSLLLGGGVCLAVGFVLNSAVPGAIREAVGRPASYSSDIPWRLSTWPATWLNRSPAKSLPASFRRRPPCWSSACSCWVRPFCRTALVSGATATARLRRGRRPLEQGDGLTGEPVTLCSRSGARVSMNS